MPEGAQFEAPAEKYDRWMGRFSAPLAVKLADVAGVGRGQRVVDVGCGPGALTTVLATRTEPENIAAIDPAAQFADACRARVPAADVRVGVAEELPWDDHAFDAALSCLVIGFMKDADQGVREMARVTKPGGRVAACMWDISGGRMEMLGLLWRAIRQVKPEVEGERGRPGIAAGDIADRFDRAGLGEIEDGELTVSVEYADRAELWEASVSGVGPAGQALASLGEEEREAVKEACWKELPDGPFSLDGTAWYAAGHVTS